MSLKDDIPDLVKKFEDKKNDFCVNEELIDIFEGNLFCYLDRAMKESLSEESYKQAKDRIAPINVFRKIINKVACIYTIAPSRLIENGSEGDKELLSNYEKELDVNALMDDGTDLFETSRSCLIQPFVENKKPKMRVIPNDRFFVASNNVVDPTEPTHIVTFDILGPENVIFYAYTKDEFLIFNNKKEVLTEMMANLGLDGTNPYKELPFVYANSSRLALMPKPDKDSLRMAILIPLLLSDLNFALKFQCFSIVYGINVNDENLKMAPNAFWRMNSDPTGGPPEIGVIKPSADFQQAMGLIGTELSMWMDTRGIRAAGVGQANPENFSSAVSKMVDEADTTEARLALAEYFSDIESKFWKLFMHTMLPYWKEKGLIETNAAFSPEAEVRVSYQIIEPVKPRAVMVQDLKVEVEAGFMSRKMAMKKLYPDLDDKEIQKLMDEIDAEKKANLEAQQAAMGTGPGTPAEDDEEEPFGDEAA